jgi:hypothetical protein
MHTMFCCDHNKITIRPQLFDRLLVRHELPQGKLLTNGHIGQWAVQQQHKCEKIAVLMKFGWKLTREIGRSNEVASNIE